MMNTAALAALLSHPTYTTIKGRMQDVGIDLTQFMDISPVAMGTGKLCYGLTVEDTVLGGIGFKIKMPPALQQALGTALKTNPDLLAKLRRFHGGLASLRRSFDLQLEDRTRHEQPISYRQP